MSKDNPVFVSWAVSTGQRDEADPSTTRSRPPFADLVGSYDVALTYKDDGKVHVTKHEKPTQHGAWTGAAVGALVRDLVPTRDPRLRARRRRRRRRDRARHGRRLASDANNSATTSTRVRPRSS